MRVARSLPLPCFGLEFSAIDPTCQQCPHRAPCHEFSGPRAGQVRLSHAVFKLDPPRIAPGPALDAGDLTGVYQIAYAQIFGRAPRELPAPKQSAEVHRLAQALKLSAETFIYACLLGHQISCPERPFSPRHLGNATAQKRAQFYRRHAVERFGTLDPAALCAVTGGAPPALREALLYSEQLFGGWIVGSRCSRGGNGVAALYAQRELTLSPSWLTIEPTYQKWVASAKPPRYTQPDESGKTVFNELARHRHAIHLIPPASRPELTRLRSTLMPSAVAHVLQKHGQRAENFSTASPVTDSFQFWLRLGDALLQLKLLHQLP